MHGGGSVAIEQSAGLRADPMPSHSQCRMAHPALQLLTLHVERLGHKEFVVAGLVEESRQPSLVPDPALGWQAVPCCYFRGARVKQGTARVTLKKRVLLAASVLAKLKDQ